MTRLVIGLIFGFSISLIANELTSEQKLKAENFQLKVQLSQCNTSLINNNLTMEQQKLLIEFKNSLNASEDEEFDWNSLTFKKKK